MSQPHGSTNLERQIRSQPDELERLLADAEVREQVHTAAEGLHRARRIWVVGTGTSQHAADARRRRCSRRPGASAHAVSSMQFVRNAPIVGPHDGVVVITHTGETAYALGRARARVRGRAADVTIRAAAPRFNDVVETVDEGDLRDVHGELHGGGPRPRDDRAEMGADSDHRRGSSRPCPGCRRATRSRRPASTPSRTPTRLLVDRRRRARVHHGPRGRAEGARGRARPRRGVRRRVPPARLRGPPHVAGRRSSPSPPPTRTGSSTAVARGGRGRGRRPSPGSRSRRRCPSCSRRSR